MEPGEQLGFGPGALRELALGGPQNETGAPWPDDSPEPVDDLVGKVLFTLGILLFLITFTINLIADLVIRGSHKR